MAPGAWRYQGHIDWHYVHDSLGATVGRQELHPYKCVTLGRVVALCCCGRRCVLSLVRFFGWRPAFCFLCFVVRRWVARFFCVAVCLLGVVCCVCGVMWGDVVWSAVGWCKDIRKEF